MAQEEAKTEATPAEAQMQEVWFVLRIAIANNTRLRVHKYDG